MDRWKSAELWDKYDKRIPDLTAFVLWVEAVFITAYFNELLYVTANFSLFPTKNILTLEKQFISLAKL